MATIIDALEAPAVLERERSLSWVPFFQNERGPATIDGTYQTRNANGGGLWAASFSSVQIRTAEQRKAWRAFQIQARGGMVPIDVPVCAERPRSLMGTTVQIYTVDGWEARAVSGRVDLVDSTEIEAGMFFSDYDATTYGWRLYLIESVVTVGSPGGATQRDITFWPPARFAAGLTGSHQLEFAHPRCVMQLASSDSMDLELDQRRFGNPSAEFIECGI